MKYSPHTNHALKNLLYLFALLLLAPSHAAAGLPYEVLPEISDRLYRPEDVAISADYQIYVADPGQNLVLVYNFENRLTDVIPVAAPSAVAVSHDGTLYAASGKDLSVEIISSDGISRGFLGQGKNEFRLPRNIAIDPTTGNVLVVDQLDHGIKIYTANGEFLTRIDDTPNLPIDIAIHNNEMFVLDQPLLQDGEENIRGARILIYGLDGKPTAYFGSFGVQNDQFVSPRALAIDSSGIIYISDFFHGVIRSFDIWGNLVQTIQDPNCDLLSPKGLAMDGSGRLAAASSLTASIRLYHLPGRTPATGGGINISQPTETMEKQTDMPAAAKKTS